MNKQVKAKSGKLVSPPAQKPNKAPNVGMDLKKKKQKPGGSSEIPVIGKLYNG